MTEILATIGVAVVGFVLTELLRLFVASRREALKGDIDQVSESLIRMFIRPDAIASWDEEEDKLGFVIREGRITCRGRWLRVRFVYEVQTGNLITFAVGGLPIATRDLEAPKSPLRLIDRASPESPAYEHLLRPWLRSPELSKVEAWTAHAYR